MRERAGIWRAKERAGDEERATMGLENVNLTAYSQITVPHKGPWAATREALGKGTIWRTFETHSRTLLRNS